MLSIYLIHVLYIVSLLKLAFCIPSPENETFQPERTHRLLTVLKCIFYQLCTSYTVSVTVDSIT